MKGYLNVNNYPLTLFFIIIYLNISKTSGILSHSLSSFLSKITIKINEAGNQKILSSEYNGNQPDLITLNGNQINLAKSKEYGLNNCLNIIELTWNNHLTICSKMFSGCSKIIEIDLSEFNGSKVTAFDNMFENCTSLTSIIISNLDTSSARNMSGIFFNCFLITSLNLSNFNTDLVKRMDFMFSGCKLLSYLNILSFNTSKVEQMKRMFFNCESLTSLNLSNFDTSNVWMMVSMFNQCKKLQYLDLSSFNTLKARNINSLFADCDTLKSLNLSNFIKPPLIDIQQLFLNNYNLEYLDISNFDTSKVTTTFRAFYNCKSLKFINLSNFNTSYTKNMEEMFANCDSLIYLDLSNFNTHNVTNMKKMFLNCINLKYINLKISKDSNLTSFSNIFLNTPEKMIFCIDESLNSKLFNFIISNKKNSSINCSETLIEYFKELPLLSTVSTTSNVVIDSTLIANEKTELNNPINNLPTQTIIEIPIEQTSILPFNILKNTIIFRTDKIQIQVSHLLQQIKFNCFLNNTINNCYFENIDNIRDNEEFYNLIVDNFLRRYSNEEASSQVIEGKDNIIYEITNNKNQLNKLKNLSLSNNNLSIIDFGKCEDILKNEYNINQNVSLIILKQENISNNIKASEKNVQYEIYEPYNKTKLNFSLCEGISINIYTKMTLSEDTKNIYEKLKKIRI